MAFITWLVLYNPRSFAVHSFCTWYCNLVLKTGYIVKNTKKISNISMIIYKYICDYIIKIYRGVSLNKFAFYTFFAKSLFKFF